MYLSIEESQQATKKRNLITKYFSEGVRLCNSCAGTGLDNFSRNSSGDAIWDGVSFCNKCNGIGYLKWKETMLHKLCPVCKGSGGVGGYNRICSTCNGEGILDWIQYMRVGTMKNE